MLPNLTMKTTRLTAGTVLASLLVLAACDQQGTRLERARELADATLDQISGRAVVEPGADQTLLAASVMDRAIAGTLVNDIAFQAESERAMFAIGSIIAKPKDIQTVAFDEEDALMLEEDELFEEVEPEMMVVEEAPASAGRRACASRIPVPGTARAPDADGQA